MRTNSRYLEDTTAVAAIEAALLFPILLLLLLGLLDIGYGILASQKTIRASQIVADLVARNISVNDQDIDDAIEAGKLALMPFDTGSFGIDIASITFDEDGNAEVCWRETRNMPQNSDVPAIVDGLGIDGEGILAITVRYGYEPGFSSNVFDKIEMEEIAYTRGRSTAIVEKNGGCE